MAVSAEPRERNIFQLGTDQIISVAKTAIIYGGIAPTKLEELADFRKRSFPRREQAPKLLGTPLFFLYFS